MSFVLATHRLKTYTSFVKLEHTIFSLPLVYAGAVLGAHGWPTPSQATWILMAAIGGRVVAMGLNRLVDVQLDASNPRTKHRELPRGAMSRREAWIIVGAAGALYLFSAATLAPICLWFSPIPVALFVGYPYLKRFTSLAHLGLGLTWSMAPVGGWLATSQSLEKLGDIGWLWLFSILWVAGFDIIYATLDEAFDRDAKLHSLPVQLGRKPALRVAIVLHALAFGALCLLWASQLRSSTSLLWLAGIGALFIWQHALAERKPEVAFFQLNGLVGFLVLGLVLAGIR